MYGIRIQLIGEVAFESHIKLSVGYRCDIPTDRLGIPFLPLMELLNETPELASVPDVLVGFARPDGYLGLIHAAENLVRHLPHGEEQLRALYTNDRFYADQGFRVRSLKKGQCFLAPVYFHREDLDSAARLAASIRQLGIQERDITGEVECTLCMMDDEYGLPHDYSDILTYHSLEYSLLLLTPASLYAPFENGKKTYPYIPGRLVREALLHYQADSSLAGALPDMRFSNAYISDGVKRLLPVPLCMSVVKLDKEQLRYRLAPGKDPARAEQNLTLNDAFSERFEDHYMEYVKPETERITSKDGALYDALSQGQVFKGTVYGTDSQLRSLAEWIRTNPRICIGSFTEEGFGEAYIALDCLREDPIRAESLSSVFDVACLSHTMILNEEGMMGCRAEDLLSELEYLTDLPGRLEIVDRYTDVFTDYSDRFGWGQDGPVTRCLHMGSVLRVRTKDGQGVDISPILHTFIGENNRDGYGEIMAFPARDGYYRVTRQVYPRKYAMGFQMTCRDLHLGAGLVHKVLSAFLKSRASGLGEVDALDSPDQAKIPMEILRYLMDKYTPEADMQLLKEWYLEGLSRERDKNERD